MLNVIYYYNIKSQNNFKKQEKSKNTQLVIQLIIEFINKAIIFYSLIDHW